MVKEKRSKQPVLEHPKSYNSKIFFDHGEGKSIPNKPLRSFKRLEYQNFLQPW